MSEYKKSRASKGGPAHAKLRRASDILECARFGTSRIKSSLAMPNGEDAKPR